MGYLLWGIFILLAVLRIYSKGTFRRTGLVRGAYIGISLVIMGSLFKIQHWPNATLLILLGCLMVSMFYTFHFIRKTRKGLFDFLKFFYVLILAALIPATLSHYQYTIAITWIQVINAVAMIAVFYIREWNGEPPALPEVSEGDEHVFRYSD